jgi:hypothetical protein
MKRKTIDKDFLSKHPRKNPIKYITGEGNKKVQHKATFPFGRNSKPRFT